jgi:hypothetical protein
MVRQGHLRRAIVGGMKPGTWCRLEECLKLAEQCCFIAIAVCNQLDEAVWAAGARQP